MKKHRVLKRSAMAIAIATVFLLSACASGGGGGGSSGGGPTPSSSPSDSSTPLYSPGVLSNYNFTPSSRQQVPFSTPTLVSTFSPFSTPTVSDSVSAQYVVHNLTGDSGDDIIITGRQSQPATPATWSNSTIQLFDWQNGQLVNDTAKWFPNGINNILGTDPTVQFADFFHTGHIDMFISPSTDMQYYGTTQYSQAWLYTNTGSQFNLTTVNLGTQVWAHGASLADLTGSGYLDVLMTGYASNGPDSSNGTVFLMNNHVNGFTPYIVSNFPTGGSSIVAADFLGNGQTQVVVTDSCCTTGMGSYKTTQMYSWNIDTNNILSFSYIKNLPTPIFDQPQYGWGPGSTHNYLALTYDFIGNGIPDLVLFGAPVNGAKMSAIQFLQNDGHGNFTDVTSSMLIGYNANTYGSYHPQFIDLGNRQQSMIVSSTDWSGANNSTQVLIKQSASGPYVAAFQNIITDFAAEANLIAGINNSANQVAMVKDPSNNLYLVSTVQYNNGRQQMMGAYISLVGGAVSPITAQTAFNQVKATWPWMSPAQVNQVLAQTSSSYMTDAGPALELNPNNLLNPVGSLSVATRAGSMSLSGGIAGVNLGSSSQIQAFDSTGRNFTISFANNNYTGPNSFNTNTEHIDQYNLTSHAEYLLNGNANTVYTPFGPMRLGMENRNQWNTMGGPIEPKEFGDQSGNQGMYLGMVPPRQWSFGLPEVYRKGNFYTGVQYTNLNSNPWINFSGSFGMVQNSGTLEQVATYARDGFSVQGAIMRTTTNFVPGLVTQVTPITAAWAETGYRYTRDEFGDLGVYLGVKPVVLNGSVTANMPTSVDNNGNPVYTTNKMGIVSQTTPYIRLLYTGTIDRNSGYRLSGMTTSTGQFRTMAEYRYAFN
jgi:hypothetical protein